MPSSCYRCGVPVEQQVPFCRSCGAPQIRVAVPQEAAQVSNDPATLPLEPGTPASLQPPAIPVHFAASAGIQWRKYVRIALPFALASGAGIAFFVPFGIVLLIITVVLSIRRYRRTTPSRFTAAHGARLGALTALLSFPSYLLLFGLILATGFESLHAVMLDLLRQRPIQSPEYQEMLRWASTREGFLSVTMIGVFTILIILLALATAAGALEGSRKEN